MILIVSAYVVVNSLIDIISKEAPPDQSFYEIVEENRLSELEILNTFKIRKPKLISANKEGVVLKLETDYLPFDLKFLEDLVIETIDEKYIDTTIRYQLHFSVPGIFNAKSSYALLCYYDENGSLNSMFDSSEIDKEISMKERYLLPGKVRYTIDALNSQTGMFVEQVETEIDIINSSKEVDPMKLIPVTMVDNVVQLTAKKFVSGKSYYIDQISSYEKYGNNLLTPSSTSHTIFRCDYISPIDNVAHCSMINDKFFMMIYIDTKLGLINGIQVWNKQFDSESAPIDRLTIFR